MLAIVATIPRVTSAWKARLSVASVSPVVCMLGFLVGFGSPLPTYSSIANSAV
jgi:hypothetical protein